MGDELKTSPGYEYDAKMIDVFNALNMESELNREEAQYLLDRNLSSRAPLIAAQVLVRLGQEEEAISLLERIYQTQPEWGDQIRKHSFRFQELQDRYGARFKSLTLEEQ